MLYIIPCDTRHCNTYYKILRMFLALKVEKLTPERKEFSARAFKFFLKFKSLKLSVITTHFKPLNYYLPNITFSFENSFAKTNTPRAIRAILLTTMQSRASGLSEPANTALMQAIEL